MLVCVILISPLLNFMADKVDSLATLDVQGGPVCCASSTSSPQQCFYALLNHLGGHFVMSSLVVTDINGILVRVAYASEPSSWSKQDRTAIFAMEEWGGWVGCHL